MGHAIDFPQRNSFFGKPEEMSNHQCYALPVCKFITLIPGVLPRAPLVRQPASVSCWKLTDEEIELLKETKVVYLRVLGTGMIPVNISAFNPIDPDRDTIPTREEMDQVMGYEQPKGPVNTIDDEDN